LLDESSVNSDPKVAGEIRSVILGLSGSKVELHPSHNLFEAKKIGTHVAVPRLGGLGHSAV
jgi:hypothetical protein